MPPLTATLKVRVEPALRRELDREARAAGIPLGTHLRIILRGHVAAKRPPEGR